MAKGVIVSIRDVTGDLRQPGVVTHKAVDYTIDDKGPFSILFPIGEWAVKEAQDLVQAKVNEWASIVGKPIESR